MLRRLLNIASIVCLVACVELIGFWVRSYHCLDAVTVHVFTYAMCFASEQGRLCYDLSTNASGPWRWVWLGIRTGDETSRPWGVLGFYFEQHGGWTNRYLPYWFVIIVSGSLAMVLRVRSAWRFNLRSLFIATAVAAVVLGMVAWLDRASIGK
jgi:hypothetical protein